MGSSNKCFSLYFLFFDHSAAVQGTRNEEQAELGLVCAGPWWREFVLKGGGLVAQELFRVKEFGYFSSHCNKTRAALSHWVIFCFIVRLQAGAEGDVGVQTGTHSPRQGRAGAWTPCSSCIPVLLPGIRGAGSCPGTLHKQTPPPGAAAPSTTGTFCQPGPDAVTSATEGHSKFVSCIWKPGMRAREGSQCLPSCGVSCFFFFFW